MNGSDTLGIWKDTYLASRRQAGFALRIDAQVAQLSEIYALLFGLSADRSAQRIQIQPAEFGETEQKCGLRHSMSDRLRLPRAEHATREATQCRPPT